MYVDFSDLFHESSKDLTGHGTVHIPSDSRLYPKEWHTVYYKTYPRLSKVQLEKGSLDASLESVLQSRKSRRMFSGEPMSLSKLSLLLQLATGIQNRDKSVSRTYPSGGARFPVEIYPIVFKGSDIAPGVYHYNIFDHSLDVLWERDFSESDVGKLYTYKWAEKGSLAIVMTSTFWRTQNKYGERGYRYILFESGFIGQNMYLVGQALGLNCCAITGARDHAIERTLDIDGIAESVLYSVVFG